MCVLGCVCVCVCVCVGVCVCVCMCACAACVWVGVYIQARLMYEMMQCGCIQWNLSTADPTGTTLVCL